MAFLAAGLGAGKYARPGYATCATCGDVDEGARARVFAVSLDLGLVLAEGMAKVNRDADELMAGVSVQGVPYCAHCAPTILLYALTFAARETPRECPCASVEFLEPRIVPHWGFACGLVLAGELARCDVCRALGTMGGLRAEESSGRS